MRSKNSTKGRSPYFGYFLDNSDIFVGLKLIAYILSFYILFCAIAPCYLFDNCEETEQYADTKSKPVEDCNSCSPFSTCSSCHGFSFNQESFEIEPLVFYSAPIYANRSFSSKSGYPDQFFQPPRMV